MFKGSIREDLQRTSGQDFGYILVIFEDFFQIIWQIKFL